MSALIGLMLIALAVGLAVGHTLGYRRGYRDAEIDEAEADEHGDIVGIDSGTLPANVVQFGRLYGGAPR
jgi:hypothetical protein